MENAKKMTEGCGAEQVKKYQSPKMEKHDPVKVVQGSGGCSGYYYTSLYYTYYYYYY